MIQLQNSNAQTPPTSTISKAILTDWARSVSVTMATAYLLASVLTLIVVLVHGQEAFPEQGNIVVVAEDSFEDELNSFTDLILPGSANTRAECIQKKKCKNKGGTCQNKGNTCPGKFVKGCSKGCSCCLPEEISCKPSKRCKRANGACIARGECNGKIISTGCKKPRSCKKTHVCCVQDETTTEVPTCRGPSCPLPGLCDTSIAASNFPHNYVCDDCKTSQQAEAFLKRTGFAPAATTYRMFAGKLSDGTTPISYTDIISGSADRCQIVERVQVWDCKKKTTWTCSPQGFCTAEIKRLSGVYTPEGTSLKCTCQNPFFEDKHVCSNCDTADKALAFVKAPDSKPPGPNRNVRDIFNANGGMFTYQNDAQGKLKLCLVTNPTEVMSWKCNAKNVYEWKDCEPIGYCTYIRSKLTDGHFEYQYKICYKRYIDKKWETGCSTLADMGSPATDNAASCMFECKGKTGCNAFNFKLGVKCILKKCTAPYPNAIGDPTDQYVAYYDW